MVKAIPHEVEVKFAITDLRRLTRTLRQAGFSQITPSTHEMNVLYDLPGQQLSERGDLLRLRQYGTRWIITHKAKGITGRHKVRVERETSVADGKAMDAILQALGFRTTFRYEKYRAEWSDGKGHVVLDKTPVGNFGEIEGSARWIDRTARKLQVSRESYITQTYAQLFNEWKRRTGSPAMEMTFSALEQK